MDKPGRPLGLSLAIFASVVLFTILPMAQILFILHLQYQFRAVEFLDAGGAVGGDLEVSDVHLLVPMVIGMFFLLVAVFAWQGKPQSIRWVFMAAVMAITAITLALTFLAVGAERSLDAGLDSGADLGQSLLWARATVSILVALYVIWYANRGPARAFYRGYYLPDPEDSKEEKRRQVDELDNRC